MTCNGKILGNITSFHVITVIWLLIEYIHGGHLAKITTLSVALKHISKTAQVDTHVNFI